MKNIFASILFFLTLYSTDIYGQTNDWIWGRSSVASGSGPTINLSVATDHSGNVYITGQFHQNTISFGSYLLTNSDQTGVTSDVYITKYDSLGNVVWAKRAGYYGYDSGTSLCIDSGGNLLTAGWFSGSSITFGSTTITNSSSSYEMYVVKYDPNGNVIWAKSEGNSGFDLPNSLMTDSAGNVFVAGSFNSSTITFGTTTLINTGNNDAFLVKYDPNGNVLWAKSAGGTMHDIFSSVSTDGFGNAYVTGYFESTTMNFGSVSLTNTNSSDRNFLIAKYDSTGNVLWAKSAGGTLSDEGISVSAVPSGGAYVTGYFYSSTIGFGTSSLTNTGLQDAFIARYDELGNVTWARSATNSANDVGQSVSTDDDGNVYLSGRFDNDSITFGSTVLIAPAGFTIPLFVLKYDLNGNQLCSSVLASGGLWSSISADPFGNAYVSGAFWSNPFIVGNDTLTLSQSSLYDVVVAKYDCNNNVGVNELSNQENISLYPNPTNGIVTLKSEKSKGAVIIHNVLGEIIFQSQINNSITIDLSDQPAGMYFVNVISGSKSYSGKLIKE